MAKDDYFKLVYLILKYLYDCLRNGKKYVSVEEIKVKVIKDDIPEEYFNSIVEDLEDEGYIKTTTECIKYVHVPAHNKITGLKISMQGIEYLQNNSTMKKVAEFLKTIGNKGLLSFTISDFTLFRAFLKLVSNSFIILVLLTFTFMLADMLTRQIQELQTV